MEAVCRVRATIGESPIWVAPERVIYWIDIKAPALHASGLDDGHTKTWPLSSDVGAFALTRDDAAVVALRHGIHRLDLQSGTLELLAPPPFDPALFRFNEGLCDSAGRFWVGVMFDPLKPDERTESAGLHCFTLTDGLRPFDDMSDLHNGMAWNRDESRLYIAHSNSGEIFVYDYDLTTGSLSGRRLFAAIPEDEGIPDGAALDAEGGYWTAIHGGGSLRRYKSDGTFDREIKLPVSQPTMPVFAGKGLDVACITSASEKLSERQLGKQPLAGMLACLDLDVRGWARPYLVN